MSPKGFVAALVGVMVLSSLACRLATNVPVDKVTTGPTREESIDVPVPDSELADLTLSFGAGQLNIESGAQDALVSGKATYNVDDLKPKVTIKDDEITLETGNLDLKGIPTFSDKVENTWDLKLSDHPMNLKIGAGAYDGQLDLGDLSLRALDISDGAANVRLDFSQPNLIEMEKFSYSTGASSVRLSGLANANFAEMAFKSGAGDYSLDFSGELKRDAAVRIESGISNMVIIVPEGVSCKVIFDGGLTSIKTSGNWTQAGDAYTLNGSGPTLTIDIDMSAGSLELRTH